MNRISHAHTHAEHSIYRNCTVIVQIDETIFVSHVDYSIGFVGSFSHLQVELIISHRMEIHSFQNFPFCGPLDLAV